MGKIEQKDKDYLKNNLSGIYDKTTNKHIYSGTTKSKVLIAVSTDVDKKHAKF